MNEKQLHTLQLSYVHPRPVNIMWFAAQCFIGGMIGALGAIGILILVVS